MEITAETNFEDLVQQIKDSKKNSASQIPCTDKQTIAMNLALLSWSRFYIDDCWDWNRKNKTNQTWDKFKEHFWRGFWEVMQRNKTAMMQDYAYLAHLVESTLTKIQKHHNNKMANFTTSTQNDQNTFAPLLKQVKKISSDWVRQTKTSPTLWPTTKRTDSPKLLWP